MMKKLSRETTLTLIKFLRINHKLFNTMTMNDFNVIYKHIETEYYIREQYTMIIPSDLSNSGKEEVLNFGSEMFE